MEVPDSEEPDEGWTTKAIKPKSIGSSQQSSSQRKQGRWRSVEEYQEWKRLRQELDDLESF